MGTTERWLPLVGFEGEYEVSDFGRIRSLDRWVYRYFRKQERWTRQWRKGQLLALCPIKSGGYYVVHLPKAVRVHIAVLEAFVGPCPEGMECRHLDGDPTHNRLSNLCWGTQARNNQDKKYHGVTGSHCSKLGPDDVRWIRAMAGSVSQRQLAKQAGVHRTTIYDILVGRSHEDVL